MGKEKKYNTKYRFILIALLITAGCYYYLHLYSGGYYSKPLHIPVELAADFGEVRENHFHLGLDIRTDGKENLSVYAAADGFISRITIEENGYGKALYITHTNGTTTLYAHLNHFTDELDEYVHAKQYHDECWQQDITLPANKFMVKRGQFIAYSGNTGTSEGPHLHFEIRDNHTGKNINPLTAGFTVTDNIAPVIHSLYCYNRTGSIYKSMAMPIDITGDNNNYHTAEKIVTVNCPRISFGIEAIDKNEVSKYRLGIYKACLYMDDAPRFCFTLNSFLNTDQRYVNACIDYPAWITSGKCIQYLCRLPGNRLPVFDSCRTDGILNLQDRKIHTIKIIVTDAAGNAAALNLKVQYDGAVIKNNHAAHYKQLLLPGKTNHAETANAMVDFSSRAFYDTVPLTLYEEKEVDRNTASPAIHLLDATIPVHDSFRVRVKTTLVQNNPLRKHVVMQLTNEKHSITAKGRWTGNSMLGYFMELGNVQLIIDTIAPEVVFTEGDKTLFAGDAKALHIVCKDNLGDIYFFRGELDGHWVLFEKKGDRFTYFFDEHCKPGNHVLTITAGDKANNITQERYTFRTE